MTCKCGNTSDRHCDDCNVLLCDDCDCGDENDQHSLCDSCKGYRIDTYNNYMAHEYFVPVRPTLTEIRKEKIFKIKNNINQEV